MRQKIFQIIYNKLKTPNPSKTKYGLLCLIIFFEKIFILLIISIILNITKEVITFIIFYAIIKSTTFGPHLTKSSHCTIISLLIFIPASIISTYQINPQLAQILFFSTAIYLIIISPKEYKNRKIKKNQYKLLTTFILILFTILFYKTIYSNYILTAIISQAIIISYPTRKEVIKC